MTLRIRGTSCALGMGDLRRDCYYWTGVSAPGQPLEEPVAWYGPIVMNTQEQLRRAFEELEEGTFLKQKQGR